MISEFTEPEANSYTIQVYLCGVCKDVALQLAEAIRLLADMQLPQTGLSMTVAHVKYDLL
jgi:hypothetical protein